MSETNASAEALKCQVCGELRPTDKLSVWREEFRADVAYCNDRAACLAGARTRHIVRGALQAGRREVDSSNQFAVGARGDRIIILSEIPQVLTRERAVNLAAWLALLADPDGSEFRRMTEAIRGT